MMKSSYFGSYEVDSWPEPDQIRHYFLGAPGQRWFFDTGADSGIFTINEGNGDPLKTGRIDLVSWGSSKMTVRCPKALPGYRMRTCRPKHFSIQVQARPERTPLMRLP
jgi:hypothetical protein